MAGGTTALLRPSAVPPPVPLRRRRSSSLDSLEYDPAMATAATSGTHSSVLGHVFLTRHHNNVVNLARNVWLPVAMRSKASNTSHHGVDGHPIVSRARSASLDSAVDGVALAALSAQALQPAPSLPPRVMLGYGGGDAPHHHRHPHHPHPQHQHQQLQQQHNGHLQQQQQQQQHHHQQQQPRAAEGSQPGSRAASVMPPVPPVRAHRGSLPMPQVPPVRLLGAATASGHVQHWAESVCTLLHQLQRGRVPDTDSSGSGEGQGGGSGVSSLHTGSAAATKAAEVVRPGRPTRAVHGHGCVGCGTMDASQHAPYCAIKLLLESAPTSL